MSRKILSGFASLAACESRSKEPALICAPLSAGEAVHLQEVRLHCHILQRPAAMPEIHSSHTACPLTC